MVDKAFSRESCFLLLILVLVIMSQTLRDQKSHRITKAIIIKTKIISIKTAKKIITISTRILKRIILIKIIIIIIIVVSTYLTLQLRK